MFSIFGEAGLLPLPVFTFVGRFLRSFPGFLQHHPIFKLTVVSIAPVQCTKKDQLKFSKTNTFLDAIVFMYLCGIVKRKAIIHGTPHQSKYE